MTTRLSKEEYVEVKKSEQKALQNKLSGFLKAALETKDGMKELTDHYRISGLYDYSFYNSLLIKLQGGTIAQSFAKWKAMDRMVEKGQKSHINVFVPMFRKEKLDDGTTEDKLFGFKLSPVFDVSQTSGETLKYVHNSGEVMDIPYDRVKAVMAKLSGVEVVEEATGNARGYSDGKKIAVSEFSNDTDKTKTLIHECSHHIIHTGKAKAAAVSYAAGEVEAESVAYLVMSFLGLDYELSKGYVAAYKDGINDARADLIIRTADKLIKGLKATMSDEERFLVALS